MQANLDLSNSEPKEIDPLKLIYGDAIELQSVKIEILKPTYLDEKFIHAPPYNLRRLNAANGRWYFWWEESMTDIEWFSGTTGPIGESLNMGQYYNQWITNTFRNYDEAMDYVNWAGYYGTFMHILWGWILMGLKVDTHPDTFRQLILNYASFEGFHPQPEKIDSWGWKAKADLIGFLRFVEDYEVKARAVEISLAAKLPLYSWLPKDHEKQQWIKIAGSLDLPAEITIKEGKENVRELVLIDLKSGRQDKFYNTHAAQLYAYRDIWNANFPTMPIGRVFNYGCKDFRIPIGKTVTPYRFDEWKNGKEEHQWQKVKLDMAFAFDKEPKFKTSIRDQIFELGMSTDNLYETFDPKSLMDAFNPPKEGIKA